MSSNFSEKRVVNCRRFHLCFVAVLDILILVNQNTVAITIERPFNFASEVLNLQINDLGI